MFSSTYVPGGFSPVISAAFRRQPHLCSLLGAVLGFLVDSARASTMPGPLYAAEAWAYSDPILFSYGGRGLQIGYSATGLDGVMENS